MVCLKLLLIIVSIVLIVFIILYVKCAQAPRRGAVSDRREEYSTPGTLGGIGQSYVSPNL